MHMTITTHNNYLNIVLKKNGDTDNFVYHVYEDRIKVRLHIVSYKFSGSLSGQIYS